MTDPLEDTMTHNDLIGHGLHVQTDAEGRAYWAGLNGRDTGPAVAWLIRAAEMRRPLAIGKRTDVVEVVVIMADDDDEDAALDTAARSYAKAYPDRVATLEAITSVFLPDVDDAIFDGLQRTMGRKA